MISVIGEVVLGEEVAVEVKIPESTYLYMYGRAPELGTQQAFINGYVLPLPSFALNSYIEGHNNLHNTTESSWGTPAQAEAEIAEIGGSNIVNTYERKLLFVNGRVSSSLSSIGRMAYIVQKAHLMNVPTREGMTNPNARRATDFGPYSNDILLINTPNWVQGPHD